jgi:hypothetical protein
MRYLIPVKQPGQHIWAIFYFLDYNALRNSFK